MMQQRELNENGVGRNHSRQSIQQEVKERNPTVPRR